MISMSTAATTLTDATLTDIALALTMEFGAPDVDEIDGDQIALRWELDHGGMLRVTACGAEFVDATIMQDELRTPVRAVRGTTNGDQVAKACRRAVDRWLAKRA